ncbi:hypothetical protein [Devosia sp.]|uniref:hypothetical protein n=1 Tax=Devosia sp. TaxID=1871048 RepID=UPI003264CD11
MSNDKKHDEKVRIEGWSAGASEHPKTSNPYRGQRSEDEAIWDAAWEDGNAGKDFVAG